MEGDHTALANMGNPHRPWPDAGVSASLVCFLRDWLKFSSSGARVTAYASLRTRKWPNLPREEGDRAFRSRLPVLDVPLYYPVMPGVETMPMAKPPGPPYFDTISTSCRCPHT